MWRADTPDEQLRCGHEALRLEGRRVPDTFEAAMAHPLWNLLVRLRAAQLQRRQAGREQREQRLVQRLVQRKPPPFDCKRAAAGERAED